jgi:hypothetical protein
MTAADMALPAPMAPAYALAPALALKERLLLLVLYVTALASGVTFIEPSPHDALMCVLLVMATVAGVRLERLILVPFLLLLVWNFGGLLSLMNVPAEEKAIQYSATSLYLATAALLFACLFARNSMTRLAVMRSAYVLSAAVISIAGIVGYFNLLPHAHELFSSNDRALGAFKDPNVFGPFLIWPALIIIHRMLTRYISLIDLGILATLQLGLFLSFSRGAWFHFAASCMVTVALTMLAAPNLRERFRIFGLSAGGTGLLAIVVLILLSFPSIGNMFAERAHLIQYYDVGSGGRFRLQEQALSVVLTMFNGMGPFEFARVYGQQQHNVYLQAFIVYGWIGGIAYVLLLLTTLWVGLRCALHRTQWQPYLITACGAFVGEMLEGFVIDTDHWRHFFLLLGMIWGLAAATAREAQRTNSALPRGLSYVRAA